MIESEKKYGVGEMKKLKAGIIGCGGIANKKHMPSIKKTGMVDMVAFCGSRDETHATAAAMEFGTRDAKVYSHYTQLLDDPEIDMVYVLTPNSSHAEISIAALDAGKHVMCEKPMAKTSAEARAMVAAAKRNGKILTIAYQNRFRPEAMYIKNCAVRGDFGDIYFAKAHALRRRAVPTWGAFLNEETQGGGPLIDIGTHALDLTMWLMDKYKPKSVMGSVYHKLSGNGDCGNLFGTWNPDDFTVEDSAFGFVTMEDGATIILESSWALNIAEFGEAKATICGTKGGADMQNGVRINGDDLGVLYEKYPAIRHENADPGLLEQLSFINAITKNEPLVVLPEQACLVTEILEAIYESGKTGKLITF